MGFFSLFSSKDPSKLAGELVTAALKINLEPEEMWWIDRIRVEPHRYISERNLLRMGMTQAGIALALGTIRHTTSPGYRLEKAVNHDFDAYLSSVSSEHGHRLFIRASHRYILREPFEMTGIFHYYLLNPNAWEDTNCESSPSDDLPAGFQEFVRKLMREPLERSLTSTRDLDL